LRPDSGSGPNAADFYANAQVQPWPDASGPTGWLDARGFIAFVAFSRMPHDADDLIRKGGRIQRTVDCAIVYANFPKH
jgi:hypothetical protein